MSHIVKARVKVPYTDRELLVRALAGLGKVVENERLYEVGSGFTRQRYPLVLIDPANNRHRIGFKENNGVWEQYQEEYGMIGRWTREVSRKIQDRYIAHHYEARLKSQGYNVAISYDADGAVELVAEEMAW